MHPASSKTCCSFFFFFAFVSFTSMITSHPPCEELFPDVQVYFVGGIHHSGTTAMQHELIRRSVPEGQFPENRVKEHFPPKTYCPNATAPSQYFYGNNTAIYKVPTSKMGPIMERMKGLRKHYPSIRMIFMIRDLPSLMWSVYKRYLLVKNNPKNVTPRSIRAMRKLAHQWCTVGQYWGKHALSQWDYTVTLEELSMNPDEVMDIIMNGKPGLKFTNETLPSAALSPLDDPTITPGKKRGDGAHIPGDRHHRERREAQAKAALYENDPNVYRRELPVETANYLVEIAKSIAETC